MAKFICGANELTSPHYDGQSIGNARNGLRQALNISDEMNVLLNEAECSADSIIGNNDTVEFVKETGTKG